MHMALFSIPLNIALKFRILLVVWAKLLLLNMAALRRKELVFRLDSRWLKKYGVTDATTAHDWILLT